MIIGGNFKRSSHFPEEEELKKNDNLNSN